jgi:hypothetical protein
MLGACIALILAEPNYELKQKLMFAVLFLMVLLNQSIDSQRVDQYDPVYIGR